METSHTQESVEPLEGEHKDSGKSILVVDDSELAREQLSEIFMTLGLRVCGHAKNGREAIRLFSELKPDLTSLDIIMPEMNGIDTYLEIKEKAPSSQVFFCSALSKAIISQEAYKKSIDPALFLEKPLDPGELRKCLNHLSKKS